MLKQVVYMYIDQKIQINNDCWQEEYLNQSKYMYMTYEAVNVGPILNTARPSLYEVLKTARHSLYEL
jgi:hypothetical protein